MIRLPWTDQNCRDVLSMTIARVRDRREDVVVVEASAFVCVLVLVQTEEGASVCS